jgi:TolB-like protein/Tfp pilus assembly protein PilF
VWRGAAMELAERLQEALAGKYTLETELTGAGMSRVFLAEEPSLERKVVVKVLPPEVTAAVSIERFRREIRLAAHLQHPNIVPVLSTGDADGLPFYVMPFVSGDTLRARLARSGELPMPEVIQILRDIVDALAYAHEEGIVHRDIKPENILLTRQHALVTDFGVAKALAEAVRDPGAGTSGGLIFGTVAYMAPEQGAGDPGVDHRSDIYAVGALGYEMLTGHQLFPGRSIQATLAAHASGEVPDVRLERPSTPDALAGLIRRALEKHPADRPQSAQDMLTVLDSLSQPSVSPGESLGARRRRLGPWVIGAAGVLAVVASVIVWTRDTPPPPRVGAPRLAVLPLENGGRSEDAYFVDGMTEAITTRLASVSGLRVIGRQSARRYRDTDKSLRQIGSELEVEYLLTGSVRWDRSSPGSHRISIRPALVRVSDETQVWGQPYDAVLSDVFELQSMVAERVAAALALTLAQRERELLAARPTASLVAYDHYLHGRFFLNQRTAKSIASAIESFERAIRADSSYARAYGGLAEAYWVLPSYSAAPVTAARERAAAAARKALELDSTLAGAYATRGSLYADAGRWADAERSYRRAITLEPDYATAHHWFSRFLVAFGRRDEAIREAETARDLEPRSPVIVANLSAVLRYARRLPEAEVVIRRALASEPNVPIHRRQLVSLLLVGGRFRQALPQLDTALATADSDVVPNLLAYQAYALARLGQSRDARRILTEATRLAAGHRWYAEATSVAHLALGDTATALSLLEDLLPIRPEWWLIAVDPLYDPIRTHPRFAALLRRMNVGCTRPPGFAGDVPHCAYLTARLVVSPGHVVVLGTDDRNGAVLLPVAGRRASSRPRPRIASPSAIRHQRSRPLSGAVSSLPSPRYFIGSRCGSIPEAAR